MSTTACMCASEDCKVNGCANLRRMVEQFQRQPMWIPFVPGTDPVPTSPGPVGWTCPKCGGVNGPAALVCFHCRPALKITCATPKEG